MKVQGESRAICVESEQIKGLDKITALCSTGLHPTLKPQSLSGHVNKRQQKQGLVENQFLLTFVKQLFLSRCFGDMIARRGCCACC